MTEEPMPISVSFSPKIRADGEILRVTITQKHEGGDEDQISLTLEQARSLVNAINGRFTSPGDHRA